MSAQVYTDHLRLLCKLENFLNEFLIIKMALKSEYTKNG